MTTYETLIAKRNQMFLPKLEFGCQIVAIGHAFAIEDWTYTASVVRNAGAYTTIIQLPDDNGDDGDYYEHEVERTDIKEILGLPLSLADVLMMLGNKDKDIIITWDGRFCYDGEGGCMPTAIPKVNLSKPVSEWPEETLKKILELIG